MVLSTNITTSNPKRQRKVLRSRIGVAPDKKNRKTKKKKKKKSQNTWSHFIFPSTEKTKCLET
jgi:hypothetical protein